MTCDVSEGVSEWVVDGGPLEVGGSNVRVM